MRVVSRTVAAFTSVFTLQACGPREVVLTPDPETDAGMALDPITGGEWPDAAQGGSADWDGGANGAASGDAGVSLSDAGGSGSKGVAADPECDFNGIWIARQNTESRALFNTPQYANNWYFFEFEQDGEDVVVKDHFDCGIEVQGSVLVQLTPETTRGLILHNRQVGRRGTLKKQSGGTCDLQIERFWNLRGVSEETYAPKPRNSTQSIAQVAAVNPLPTNAALAEDWDGDGEPGVRWVINGIVRGVRHSAQRDWNRWFTAPGYAIAARADWGQDLLVRSEFSNEEVVYAASDPALQQLSTPNASAEHTVTLRFLGRTRQDPRALAIIKSDDFETCLAIQRAIPPIKGLR